MELEDAIRTRRTHKAYAAEPVARETLEELFELARWAPNHNLTNPWRFRVVGPDSLARLRDAAGPEAAAKLDRAPTLVAVSQVRSDDPIQDEEDLCAVAVASYIVLLAAHARGLVGYWRTPGVLRTAEGRAAAGVPDDERVVGLIHLGPARQEKQPPERLPTGEYVTFLPVIPRADALASLERDSFDLVVVGGGITGAGVALDAASRGYSVALVEKSDFAAGTSSRSSKLIHGGLRYLQKFDLGLVREALLERSLLVELAPHLVRPLPMLVPSFEGKRPDRWTGVGLNMYDVMAWRRGRDDDEGWSPARHRIVDGAEALEMVPALAGRDPSAAYLFYDCQTDDVRLVLSVLGEAERFGAVIANRCEVTGLVERDGRAAGALVRDGYGGGEFELTAANVINATGVWADQLRPDELYSEEEMPRIRPSRGTHLTLARESLAVNVGVIVPAAGGRTIFVLPWLGRTLVGTTDNDYEGSLDHVPAGDEDVAYLLEALNAFFGTELGPGELTGAYAGVRPLISTGDPKKSVDISRRAELYETSSGLVTITGGKLTTWRRMAKLAVDRIVEREGREAPCRTHEIPIGQPEDPAALPEVPGVEQQSRVHLAARYGHAARDVLRLAAAAPRLAGRVSPELPDVAAEAAFAAGHEQACSLGDVLLRRTRLAVLDARRLSDPRAEEVGLVASAMAGELGWDGARVQSELDAWGEEARLEGLVPAGAARPAAERREQAPLRAGAAPEEAA